MKIALIDTFSKDELIELVTSSSTMRELIRKLGYSTPAGGNYAHVRDKLIKFNIDFSHFNKGIKNRTHLDDSDIFIENSTVTQKVLRVRYTKNKYTKYVCSICGMEPIWNGKPLTLILDHINGVNNDNRLGNLRWVCPNCNQQLPTTGYKNFKYQKLRKENKV